MFVSQGWRDEVPSAAPLAQVFLKQLCKTGKHKNNGKIFVSEDVPDTLLTQVRENFFGIEWALECILR